MNTGAEAARGELLVFTDANSMFAAGALDRAGASAAARNRSGW